MSLRIWLLVTCGVVMTACSASPYKCETNGNCVNGDGVNGVCELDGFCSFPDATCETGERYDTSAGVSGCVPKNPAGCVQQISVGQELSCLLRTDGTVWCWGQDTYGEVGNNTANQQAVSKPTQVQGLPNNIPATVVTTAEEHACALLQDNSVWCWGINDQLNLGQCPNASTTNTMSWPYGSGNVPVNSYVALRIPKWQPNQLGSSGSAAPSCASPGAEWFEGVQPANGSVHTLSAGGEHTCAIGADMNLYCWGEDVTTPVGGQAGQDFNVFGSGVPGPLIVNNAASLQNTISDVQAGDDFTCFVQSTTQSVYCFGGNQLGELASGTLADSFAPVGIATGNVSQLAMDDETVCVIADSDVKCWGNGTTGIFGPANDATANETAVTVLPVPAKTLYSGPNSETICMLSDKNGAVQCWGDNGSGEAGIGSSQPTSIDTPTNLQLASISQLKIGEYHACALTLDGSVWCWGDNSYGELGNNDVSTTPTPYPVRVDVTCN